MVAWRLGLKPGFFGADVGYPHSPMAVQVQAFSCTLLSPGLLL